MKVDSLARALGARVSGVDVAAGLSAESVRRLVDLLYEHRVLILSGQSLALQDYAAFGEHWGNPLLFHNPERRAENFPSIIPVSNAPTRGKESKDGAAHWHSDSSYEAVPASVTMLYCVEAPEEG